MNETTELPRATWWWGAPFLPAWSARRACSRVGKLDERTRALNPKPGPYPTP